MTESSQSPVVTVTKTVAAPREVVFSFFMSSEKWSRWQGTATSVDPWPGGTYTMHAPNGGVARGEVVEVVTNERFVFTWGWEGHPKVPPGSSTVTFEFTDLDGDRTLITLTHSGLPSDEVELHTAGWGHYLHRLEGVSTGRSVGPDGGLTH